jgi:hypothetical protein
LPDFTSGIDPVKIRTAFSTPPASGRIRHPFHSLTIDQEGDAGKLAAHPIVLDNVNAAAAI